MALYDSSVYVPKVPYHPEHQRPNLTVIYNTIQILFLIVISNTLKHLKKKIN